MSSAVVEPQAVASSVLDHYEDALRTGSPFALSTADGSRHTVDVRPWLARADAADHTVVRRCRGPVLDIGCGPGRVVAALRANGLQALGIDISRVAVAMTRGRGASALVRDAFGPLPDEGRWATVVLLDGNIGIGGDPLALLRRTAELVRPGGAVIVETAPDAEADHRLHLHAATGRDAVGVGWASVGTRPLAAYAARTGLRATETWRANGRDFTRLQRSGADRRPPPQVI